MAGRRWKGPGGFLGGILGSYFLFGCVMVFTFPLGEGPDEPAHFQYIQYLARQGQLPPVTSPPAEVVSAEAHQPPLYYALGALLAWPWLQEEPSLDFRPLGPGQRKRPVFAVHPEVGSSAADWAWYGLRFLSLILGAVAVWTAWQTCTLLYPGNPWPGLACCLYLAWNSQFLYHHAMITNDALASAVGGILVLLMVRTSVAEERPRFKLIGLLLGLAVLSKATVVLLAPGVALALWMRRDDCGGRDRWVRGCLSAVGLALLAASPWVVWNLALYQEPLALAAGRRANAANHFEQPLSLTAYAKVLPHLLEGTMRTLWGYFGWSGVQIPRRVFNAAAFLHLAAWGALLAHWLRRRTWSGAAAPLAAAVGCLLAGYLYWNSMTNMSGWQGRLLYPAAVPAALAFVEGLRRLLPVADALLAAALSVGLLGLLIYTYFWVIVPVFAV